MLPNAWNVYNLSASPFWQDTLEQQNPARPLSLFVGREQEIASLRDRILEAGSLGSRQAVAGELGIGKTTLVKALKADLHRQGYMTVDDFVPVVSEDTMTSLLGRVLALVYETILVNRPQTRQNAAMRDAELLVRSTRIPTGGSGLSLAGFGASIAKGVTASTPRDLLMDGPRVLRDLMKLVQGSDAPGLLLHLNNLENLSAVEAEQAATDLRDLRDLVFMHDGLHIVVVGTPDSVNDVVVAHKAVRTIFSVLHVAPLSIPQVHDLLNARYRHLQLDEMVQVTSPIEPQAVELLLDFYRGDLRGVLKALDDGVRPNIGLAPVSNSEPTSGIRPVGADALRITLQQRYGQQLTHDLDTRRREQLSDWGARTPTAAQTQDSLRRLWRIGQSAVSTALSALIAQDYVIALPRQGSAPIQYVLSGTSRLIFG